MRVNRSILKRSKGFFKPKKSRQSRLFKAILRSLREATPTESLVKTIHSTTCINHLLLAGIKGVALATHIQRNVRTQGRPGLNLVTTATPSRYFAILWMNISFHANLH
jgi:hypothetical protein